ncbi:MAG TPA: DsbA family protein [Solirubrobacteraceae bacterium]|nr:DsbA family protein [Solirubrobacteraceae bacterium]
MPASGRLAAPLDDDDHVAGDRSAPLQLVMYGDFQCPYCTAAQPILARVRDRLGERLLFAFRHFPLSEIHPDAERAAEVAEAAAAQGAFWEMHDALYRLRGELGERDVLGAARKLGLDARRIEAELRDGVHAARVQRDLESGRGSGVHGTPGFFANGAQLDGAFDARSLIEALERSAG